MAGTWTSRLRTIGVPVAAVVVLVLVIAWLSGLFGAKTGPGRLAPAAAPIAGTVVEVELRSAPRMTPAVGTIRAVHETAVGSRLLARVQEVHVTAGQAVAPDEILIELDSAEIEARRRQAQASLDAATAREARARTDTERIDELRQRGAATPQELNNAQRALEVAVAEVEAETQALDAATTQLAYATVRAPIGGIVVDKLVEEGDLARPGQSLVTLYDPQRLQLVADVPERLALGMEVGQPVQVEVEALGLQCQGLVAEIVPQASPASRSLEVKVTGPCPPGVVTGMFGRLLIPSGEVEQLLVPVTAVRRVGQLEMVQVVTDDGAGGRSLHRRFVRTGQVVDDRIEILAGLSPGEQVLTAFGHE
jgi:RND family efflux transporter MFP subunit